MPITALPAPPTRADSATFATRADAFMTALPAFATEANTLQSDVNTKQTTASTAAATATTKASESSTSATNAATSEANALASRNAAQTAQVAAEAALDYFDDRYLGAKAAAPTLDNDGAALLTGALYFDTALVALRVRTAAAAWLTVPANIASSTAFTPTGGISAVDVQAALAELDTEKAPLSAATAGGTSLTPVGGVGATNVQAAIAELDTEKANAAGAVLTGTTVIVSPVGGAPALKIQGTGATTPDKLIRANAGTLEIINHAFSLVILSLSDSGNLTATGNITASSDERLKKDWADLPPGFLDQLSRVKVGTYNRLDIGERHVGVSAQSLQSVLPEAVIESSGDEKMLSVAYGNAALAACVELAKAVIALRSELNMLKA